MNFSKTEQFFFDVAKPVAEALGCYVYDVEYTKEGGHFYMRILVDKDGGISIDECKDINHEIGKKIESVPIMVVKKDGTRESFDRDKILNGIRRACEKRPISADKMEEVVASIELQLSNMLIREVSSEKIGQMVMDELQKLDDIAYVRFASVYRQFKDINTFMDELAKLLSEK